VKRVCALLAGHWRRRRALETRTRPHHPSAKCLHSVRSEACFRFQPRLDGIVPPPQCFDERCHCRTCGAQLRPIFIHGEQHWFRRVGHATSIEHGSYAAASRIIGADAREGHSAQEEGNCAHDASSILPEDTSFAVSGHASTARSLERPAYCT